MISRLAELPEGDVHDAVAFADLVDRHRDLDDPTEHRVLEVEPRVVAQHGERGLGPAGEDHRRQSQGEQEAGLERGHVSGVIEDLAGIRDVRLLSVGERGEVRSEVVKGRSTVRSGTPLLTY